MIKQIKRFWDKNIKYRNAKLTPKGECFKKYCEKIYNNSLDSQIEAYEDFIWHIRDIVIEECNLLLTREETVELILKSYQEIL